MPRAKLYDQWTVSTNDAGTLKTLVETNFNPHTTVLVASAVSGTPSTGTNTKNKEPGNVFISKYSPKRIELEAQVTRSAILLLNDKFDPQWKVTVNGQPASVLRCNYLMRGVYLEPGERHIVFSFEPPVTGLRISLAALGLGAVLIICLAVVECRSAKSVVLEKSRK